MWTAEAIREAREQIMQCPQTLGNVRDFALMSIALDALDEHCEGGEAITMEQAQAWVDHMDNADTSRPHGGRWTYAEATELGHKLGVPDDQMIAFFAAINMIWSDGKGSTAARFCAAAFLRVCRLAAATGFPTSALVKLHKSIEGGGTLPHIRVK